MPTRRGLSNAVNRLWLPRASLSLCVRAIVSRDTVGASLDDHQRLNHFPAIPLCSVNWWFEGRAEWLTRGPSSSLASPRRPLPSDLVFSGPRSTPVTTWTPEASHGMILLLMPDALWRMTGIEPADHVDRFVDARTVLPAPWLEMCEAVGRCADDDARVARIERFLAPLWESVRPGGTALGNRSADWARTLAAQAATSRAGRSLRQVERRIKRWGGMSMRELRVLGRAEQAFFRARDGTGCDESPNWAAVADDSGYSDQSHLVRTSRRVSGFSPQALYRGIEEDEAFWAYRLWR